MGVERPIINWITKVLKDKRTKQVTKSIGQGLRLKRMCDKCTANNRGVETKTDHDQHEDASGNTYHFCNTCGTHN